MDAPRHPFLPPLGRSLVLASRSPRRAQILRDHGLSFEILPTATDETALEGESPSRHVLRLGTAKAEAAASLRPGAVCLGCDTVVVLDGRILGKPKDERDAESILARLSGREHVVYSSVAFVQAEEGFSQSDFETTRVRMRELSAEEIAAYVATGEPLDKAGAYGIQGYGSMLVEAIGGEYFNVMGLPVQALRRVWRAYVDGAGGRS